MGQTVELDGGGSLDAEISFRSHYPIGRVELVVNGSVAYGQEWIDKVGRYNNDQQREEVRDLFRHGREVYAELTG